MENLTKLNAFKAVITYFELEDYLEIVRVGCASFCPGGFIYYTQTTEFYDKHEQDLKEYYAEDRLQEIFAQEEGETEYYKNAIVWDFIEEIARYFVEKAIRAQLLNKYKEKNTDANYINYAVQYLVSRIKKGGK